MRVEEANKRLFRAVINEVWHTGNMEFITRAFEPTFVAVVPRQPFQNLDAYRRYVIEVREAFPDIRFRIEDQIAEGDMLVTRYSIDGTHTGPFMGIQPTGLPVAVSGITIHRVHQGRFAESWTQWDVVGMLHQLNVLEPVERTVSRS